MQKEIENGIIKTMEKTLQTEDLAWNKHATCEGVFLKHLVKGESTEGKFSCHLVRVQSGCEISQHIHADNWELHEVIAGTGKGFMQDKEIPYSVGNMIVIPQGLNHRVVAGDEDIYMIAKFIPALV